ncbi:hypothetical protein AGMMS49944_21090 [Spirochaetia bacterium]|nr:hypothetical protein AGMMS49944_21090 [Spirochaetia bacterium]
MKNKPKSLYTDPIEVSAQVNTFAWLVGNMNHENAITDNDCLGLLCIGYMISENVDAMIADFEDRADHLMAELKAAKGGSSEA